MTNYIDLEFIKKWAFISEEELMQRLVQDAVVLQEEATANYERAKIAERENDKSYNVEFIRTFLSPYYYLSQFFTAEEILAACKLHVDKKDLCKEEYVRGCLDPRHVTYGKFVGYTMHDFGREEKGTFGRMVRKEEATILSVPAPYQYSNGVSEVLYDLLVSKCPFLKQYTMKIYKVSAKNDWIYIQNPEFSDTVLSFHNTYLYAPYSALLEGDGERIKTIHRTYWHNYDNGSNDEELDEFLNGDFVKGLIEAVERK